MNSTPTAVNHRAARAAVAAFRWVHGDRMTAITVELLHEGLTTSQIAVSPDGCRIVYVVGNVVPGGPPSEVWLAPADGSAVPYPLAEGVSLPRWLPSSDAFVCLVGGRLSVVRLDGSVTELSSYDGWIGEILPLPGGSYALVVEDDTPEPEKVRVWKGTASAGGDRLAVVRPGCVAPRQLTALGTRHVVAAAAREDGRLAVVSWEEPADDPGAFTARRHQRRGTRRHGGRIASPDRRRHAGGTARRHSSNGHGRGSSNSLPHSPRPQPSLSPGRPGSLTRVAEGQGRSECSG